MFRFKLTSNKLTSNKSTKPLFTCISITFCSLLLAPPAQAEKGLASYASIDYDVVYIRCPRGKTQNINGTQYPSPNGINDLWLEASNNLYHQAGCDLVLHHSAPAYGGNLSAGDRGREQVLVNCDEDNTTLPVCTIADPNVSFDGRYVVYTKFTDTRTFVSSIGILTGGEGQGAVQKESVIPGITATTSGAREDKFFKGFNAPALIYLYDLQTGTETQVSPDANKFAGRAHPGKGTEWTSNVPVMDTGPFFMHDGRVGFTSNRDNGFTRFEMFVMDLDGSNLELRGHRAMNQQLHPAVLKDGRVVYTSHDAAFQKVDNNNYSLFTINGDGSSPFILAGKHDATQFTYHYTTQLSDGDVVTTLYYNHNNVGLGSLLRFPIDPPGADFEHKGAFTPGVWTEGNKGKRFARKGEFPLTPDADANDIAAKQYDASKNDYWTHPSRSLTGRTVTIEGNAYSGADPAEITWLGKYSHPAAAPDNDLLVTYTIGASSAMGGTGGGIVGILQNGGKDAGIWLLPLEPNSQRQILHIIDDGRIVVDFPEYHEIMPRAVVTYQRIYGIAQPGQDANGNPTSFVKGYANLGDPQEPRLSKGSPFALSGASSLYDRETRAFNGTPWNMLDGGGTMSGRTYSNLASSGAELAIFDNSEVYGVRVLLPIPPYPFDDYNGIEMWSGIQKHHLRILGEFPIRKADGAPSDQQGNPDTSFVLKIPADTPFVFQSIDKRGMALDIENSARTEIRGGQQFCIGCHVHTREGIDPSASPAKLQVNAEYGDFSGPVAPLFDAFDSAGNPTVRAATAIYPTEAPGVDKRRSFAVDWEHGVKQVIQARCASCHGAGQSAQLSTGLLLDDTSATYDLLIKNTGADTKYVRYKCCTDSRWISYNSARSSMLVWALYGERLDGRNPATGLPWGAKDEVIPADKQGLAGVLVDKATKDGIKANDTTNMLDHPDTWPNVAEHLKLLPTGMTEQEKRLIARWIDLGAPKLNTHNDMIRPVLTITPERDGSVLTTLYVGLWDDSALDYSTFKVTDNGVDITPSPITGTPDTVAITLATPITVQNADSRVLVFEIWDKPDRSLSLKSPATPAANRTRKTYTGRGLLRMADVAISTPPPATVTNYAPTSTSAVIQTAQGITSAAIRPIVADPNLNDSHVFTIVSQPTNGTASTTTDRRFLLYTPDAGFTGSDSFTFQATDRGDLSVVGTATVAVVPATAPGNPPVTPPETPPISSNSLISNTMPASGAGATSYKWFSAQNAGLVFADRPFVFSDLPAYLQGAWVLRTDNGDKQNPLRNVSFSVNQAVVVYVAYDGRLLTGKPTWLNGFPESSDVITIDNNQHILFNQSFNAGNVVLGPNSANTSNSSMYVVFVVPQDNGTTTGGGTSTGGAPGGGTDPSGVAHSEPKVEEKGGSMHPLGLVMLLLVAVRRRRIETASRRFTPR